MHRCCWLALLLVIGGESFAYACSCSIFQIDPEAWDRALTPEEAAAVARYEAEMGPPPARAIFLGRVVEVHDWTFPYGSRLDTYNAPMKWYVLEVERSWSVVNTTRVGIYSRSSIASCGVYWKVGDELVVEAFMQAPWDYRGIADASQLLGVSSCGASGQYDD